MVEEEEPRGVVEVAVGVQVEEGEDGVVGEEVEEGAHEWMTELN